MDGSMDDTGVSQFVESGQADMGGWEEEKRFTLQLASFIHTLSRLVTLSFHVTSRCV